MYKPLATFVEITSAITKVFTKYEEDLAHIQFFFTLTLHSSGHWHIHLKSNAALQGKDCSYVDTAEFEDIVVKFIEDIRPQITK